MHLTNHDITHLRTRARRSLRRRSNQRRVPARFEGGPLHGMTIAVTQYEAAGQYLGFGVTTDTGPGQVLYERTDARGVWRFSTVEANQR